MLMNDSYELSTLCRQLRNNENVICEMRKTFSYESNEHAATHVC